MRILLFGLLLFTPLIGCYHAADTDAHLIPPDTDDAPVQTGTSSFTNTAPDNTTVDGTDTTGTDTVSGTSTIALVQIEITPSNVYMRPGDTVQLSATCTFDDRITQDCTNRVTWHGTDTSVIDMTPQGRIVGVGEGDVIVTAGLNGIEQTVVVYCLPFVDAYPTLSISPAPSIQLLVGEEIQFELACEWILSVDCAQDTQWISSTPTVAQFVYPENGTLAALSAGTTVIYNQFSTTHSNEVTVTVL